MLIDALKGIWMRCNGRLSAWRVLRCHAPIRLDIGCGPDKRPGFVGLDVSRHADIRWDVRWGIPLPDESVSEIRSDHCFEHLDILDVVHALKECHRVLKPDGKLDFTVPHFDPYLEAYLRGDATFLAEKIDDIPVDARQILATPFDRIVWLMHRRGEHRSLFDKESILHKVRIAGFEDVGVRSCDPAADQNVRFSSIYVVARKKDRAPRVA